MTIWHEAHRGYRISYQDGDRMVRIARPDSNEPLPSVAHAEPGEGRSDLRAKAKLLIDADRQALGQ